MPAVSRAPTATTQKSPAAPPSARTVKATAPGGTKTLADVLPGAKVTRCPACQSDGVAQPNDFTTVQGRLVLMDSQTYRGHQWYADTGELLPTPAPPAPAATAPTPAPAARAQPAT